MIVNNFNVKCIAASPNETKAPLIVDSDAMLPVTILVKSLQAIPWRRCKVSQLGSTIQLPELSLRHALDATETLTRLAPEKPFRFLASKRFDHHLMV